METTEDNPKVVQLPLISQPESKEAPYSLLYITKAYNNREITFEQWLALTKEWAERMIAEYGEA